MSITYLYDIDSEKTSEQTLTLLISCQENVQIFLKKLFLLFMVQDPESCNIYGVKRIIYGIGSTEVFVLRRIIRSADFLTAHEIEKFVGKLYLAGKNALLHGDGMINYRDFVTSIEKFDKFSTNESMESAKWP